MLLHCYTFVAVLPRVRASENQCWKWSVWNGIPYRHSFCLKPCLHFLSDKYHNGMPNGQCGPQCTQFHRIHRRQHASTDHAGMVSTGFRRIMPTQLTKFELYSFRSKFRREAFLESVNSTTILMQLAGSKFQYYQ